MSSIHFLVQPKELDELNAKLDRVIMYLERLDKRCQESNTLSLPVRTAQAKPRVARDTPDLTSSVGDGPGRNAGPDLPFDAKLSVPAYRAANEVGGAKSLDPESRRHFVTDAPRAEAATRRDNMPEASATAAGSNAPRANNKKRRDTSTESVPALVADARSKAPVAKAGRVIDMQDVMGEGKKKSAKKAKPEKKSRKRPATVSESVSDHDDVKAPATKGQRPGHSMSDMDDPGEELLVSLAPPKPGTATFAQKSDSDVSDNDDNMLEDDDDDFIVEKQE